MKNKTLADIGINQSAKIILIDHDETFVTRLNALGMKKNKIATIIHKRTNGPLYIRISTTSFMIRAVDAKRIKVESL